MATYTDNYHLEKPAQSDLYNIDVFNDNADIIDAALASKALAQNQATIEPTNSASRNYAKGEFLVYNGLLYKVTAAISSGGTISPGTNCVATNTGTELKALNDSLASSLATTVRYKSTTVSMPLISANSGTTIEINNWSDASPYMIQFLDSSQARPLIPTNWWINGTKLSVQVTNTSSNTSDAKSVSMRTLIANS